MIAVIGAARAEIKLLMGMNGPQQDGEPGRQSKIKTFFCGSGFNIAEHLAQEGCEVCLITVLGNDPLGKAAIEELKDKGVGTAGIKQMEGITPVQVRTYNVLGDIEQEQKNDELLEQLDKSVIEPCSDILDRAEAIVLDGSLPDEAIEYVAGRYGIKGNSRLFFDPESVEGACKVKNSLKGFYCIMPGRMEAEAMTGKSILSPDELMAAGGFFHDKGISRIFITMKGGGLYYKEAMSEGILRPERILSFADTRGAGDVASAAVVAATVRGLNAEETGKYAMTKAAEYLSGMADEKLV